MPSYWKYRAFNKQLQVSDGVIVSPSTTPEEAYVQIIVALRNQGLQVVHISQISKLDYDRENYLLRLRNRQLPDPSPPLTQKPIRTKLQRIAALIFGK